MPTQKLPPEIIEAMLELSGAGEDRDALKEQLALSRALMDRGMESNARAPSHPLGGFANAASQGLQGYMGGVKMKSTMDALQGLRNRNVQNRGTYLHGVLGSEYPQVPFQRILDRDQYPDSLFQE